MPIFHITLSYSTHKRDRNCFRLQRDILYKHTYMLYKYTYDVMQALLQSYIWEECHDYSMSQFL